MHGSGFKIIHRNRLQALSERSLSIGFLEKGRVLVGVLVGFWSFPGEWFFERGVFNSKSFFHDSEVDVIISGVKVLGCAGGRF